MEEHLKEVKDSLIEENQKSGGKAHETETWEDTVLGCPADPDGGAIAAATSAEIYKWVDEEG